MPDFPMQIIKHLHNFILNSIKIRRVSRNVDAPNLDPLKIRLPADHDGASEAVDVCESEVKFSICHKRGLGRRMWLGKIAPNAGNRDCGERAIEGK